MNNLHPLDWLYDSLSSPPVAGVWWAHTLDCLYDSLSSPPVAGVWWAHTLDCLYDSLSSPPVAGVWWAHTLDCLYDSLSSSPVAGVWWAHTLDCLYDSLSSPPVAGVWWAHTLDWLYDSLSSPPVAGVWWAHHFTTDLFTNKAIFDTGFSERLKIKEDAVPSILDLTVMSHHTNVNNYFYYVITIALSVITDLLIYTKYLCVFNLNLSSIHLYRM